MTTPTGPILGINGKLYYNAGTYGSPTWTLISNAKDVKTGLSMGEADVTTRAGGGVEMTEPSLEKVEITFQQVHDPSDTKYTFIRDAYLNRTQLDVLVLDATSATQGAEGPRIVGKVFKHERDESNDAVMMQDILIKPCYSATPKSWFTAP